MARTGLLAVALLQLVVAVTLPLTHRHALSSVPAAAAVQDDVAIQDAAASQETRTAGGEERNAPAEVPHDESSCVVCRTFAGIDVVPAVVAALGDAPERVLADAVVTTDTFLTRDFSSTHSRAPPRA